MGKYLDSTGLTYFWGKFKNRLLPSGGSTGQVLAKSSATDYAVGWTTPRYVPSVTSSDNGKVLRVVNGAWAAASLPSASGVSF